MKKYIFRIIVVAGVRMTHNHYDDLPEEIRRQIDAILADAGSRSEGVTKDSLAAVWSEKFRLFSSQVESLGMTMESSFAPDDARAAILLTYSGSLVTLGPKRGKDRWLEYASIKLRVDVPDLVRGDHVALDGPVGLGTAASFQGCSVKKTSSVFRIAVCPAGASPDDQERRVREATIYITNGFIRLNRSLSIGDAGDVDQFTTKAVITYVAKKNGLTQAVTRAVVDDYLSMVETGMLLGERVPLGKLGNASLRYQAARKARIVKNLKTGEDLLVPAKPASLAPKFSFSQSVKDKSSAVDPTLLSPDDLESADDEDRD